MSENKTIVNSWNEWDPLKHVIVGRADGTCIPAPEPALDAKVPEDSDMRGQFGPRTKDTVDKANQLLDDFSSMLQKRDIKVDRPTPIEFNKKTSTRLGSSNNVWLYASKRCFVNSRKRNFRSYNELSLSMV